MRRFVLTLLMMMLVAPTLKGQSLDPYARVGEGDQLPTFEVRMSDGTTLSAESFEGKVVWITLWASWCPSCRREFKWLAASEEFAALQENENFLFVPIAREENIATASAWLKKKGYNYITGEDPSRRIYELFAEQEIPRNIIVSPDGTIVTHSTAYSRKALRTTIHKVDNLLN